MSNLYQLRLLLWKNFLIKRRLPLILFLETFIPFVLFIILGLIRHNNSPLVTYTQNAPSKALPSTGLVSMMQALCSGTADFPANGDGLPMLSENSALYRWLDQIDHIYREIAILYPNSSLALLDRMPSDYEGSVNHMSHVLPLLEQLTEAYNISSDIKSLIGDKNATLENVATKIVETFLSSSNNNSNASHQLSAIADSVNLSLIKKLLSPLHYPARNYISSPVRPADDMAASASLEGFNKIIQRKNATIMSSFSELHHDSGILTTRNISIMNAAYSQFGGDIFITESSNSSVITFNETALSVYHQRLAKFLNISHATNDAFSKQLADLESDLIKFTKFHKTLDELAKVVRVLPLDACHDDENPGPSSSPSNNDNGTAAASSKTSDYGGFLKIFESLRPILCPSHVSENASHHDHSNDSYFYTEGGALQYGRDIAQYMPVWIKILKSNPKILFTPSNTSASLVMKKANRTFEFIDQLTLMAKHWLSNTTVELHRYFSQPESEKKLRSLRLIQRHLIELLVEKNKKTTYVTNYELDLAPFLEIEIKNATQILSQLDLIDRAACSWVKLVAGANLSFFVPFAREYEAVDYSLYKAHGDNITVLAIVVFNVNDTDGTLLPHTSYKIRMNSSFLPSVRKIRPIYWSPIPRNWDYFYYFSGFAFLQDIVDRAIIDVLVGHEVIEPGTFATNVPMPCYLYDTFLFTNSMILPLCMTVSFVYSAAILVQNIVAEKEYRLKEFMKVMGLSNWVHQLAWFITAFFQLTFSMTVVTFLLRYSQVLLHSNFFIIWLLLESYAVATITFAFLISSLFSKAKIASATAGMLYFLSYVPAMCIGIREDISGGDIPAIFKNIASFLSTSAFGLSCKYISLRESEGTGVQWNNIAVSPIEHDSFSLVHAFAYLAFDSVIYAMLAWYIEQIHPGSFGIPKPWYFPFTKVYWTGSADDDEYDAPSFIRALTKWAGKLFHYWRNNNSGDQVAADDDDDDQLLKAIDDNSRNNNDDALLNPNSRNHIEPDPTGLLLGVDIDSLTKVYRKTGKVAVNNLSLRLYESQITGLLGHNGAGKTSAMSVLTGIYPPSSGRVRIYGLDIANNLDTIRASVGFCPQHDVLFEQLTPEEHLQFYSGLKRISNHNVDHVEAMLKDVGLTAKRSTPVNHLSGGMKRKLSIALAFVGKSRLVVLDEPTAGVDPYSRRAIWDLIVKYKQGRTILLSTHHMDEANVLSDRIAIISNGRLKCCGSSIFLRNNFCDGYHLICVKSDQPNRRSEEVVCFMKQLLPSSYLFSESKQELHLILPYAEQIKFGRFFHQLNISLNDIGLASYGVYDSTLEEAFLHITRTAQCEEKQTFVIKRHRRQTSDASVSSRHVPDGVGDVPLVNRPPARGGHSRQSSTGSESIQRHLSTTTNNTNNINTARHTRHASADSAQIVTMTSIAAAVVDKAPMPDNTNKPQPAGVTSLLSATDIFTVLGGGTTGHQRLVDLSDNAANNNGCQQQDVRFIHLTHFRALFIKRLLYVRRNGKVLFSQIFLPAIFISIAMSMALSAPMFGEPQPLDLSPAHFYNTTKPRGLFTPITSYYQRASYNSSPVIVLKDMDGWSDASANDLAASLHLISGLSSKCTLDSRNLVLSSTDYLQSLGPVSTAEMVKYFDRGCIGTFTEGVQMFNFRLDAITGSSNTSSSSLLPLHYPICQCASDYSGFVCPPYYAQPPTFQMLTGDYLIDIESQNMTEYLLYTSGEFRRHRYGAVAFGNELTHVPPQFGNGASSPVRRLAVRRTTNYYFEHRGYHSLPAYLNVVNNAILRANIQKSPQLGNPAAYGITTYNHPINGTDKIEFQDMTVQGTDMMIAVFVIIAMSFVPASFIVFLVYERSLFVKHTQIMAGLHPEVYWAANYIWDMLNYFVPAGCCITILVAFNVPAYVSGNNLPAIVLLFLLYGWAVTPMMYPSSFYFNDPSKAYVILVVFNLFIGTTCLITSFLLDMFHSTETLKTADDISKIAFLIFPSYCLGRGIMDVAINHYRNEFYMLSGQYDHIASPFAWETTFRNYVVMVVEGFLFFGLTILLEVGSRQFCFGIAGRPNTKKRRSWTPPSVHSSENDDADVVAERHRVLMGATSSDLLVIDGLTKQYSTKSGPLLAVDRLSLGLAPGECFGLLGLNGAGKSTTFSMLCGIYGATAGEASIGNELLCGRGKVSSDILRSVGYCPQTDPLIEELTAREHLQLYARIRGINSKLEAGVVSWLLERMGLELYADKPSRTFSGGTKRKLSAALALLGDPRVILLDEPTTGMDPGSRRFLWNLILELRHENRLVVLTSHSMEECEVLCSRLGVMVAGKLRCLGSTQQLKTKYGNGYLVTIRMPSSNKRSKTVSVAPTEILRQAFNQAGIEPSSWKFVAQRHQIIELALDSSRPDLSIIFSMLNGLRAMRQIDDFSVSQNTLDSVFLQLAHGAQTTDCNTNNSTYSSPNSDSNNSTRQQMTRSNFSFDSVEPSTVVWADDEACEERDDEVILLP